MRMNCSSCGKLSEVGAKYGDHAFCPECAPSFRANRAIYRRTRRRRLWRKMIPVSIKDVRIFLILDALLVLAVVATLVFFAWVVAGCDSAPSRQDGGAVCIAPEPGNRPLCGNPVDTDKLEVIRLELGAECVAFCCDDPADDFEWCGPREWPDGGLP